MRFAERFSDVLSGLQDITEAVNMDTKTKGKTLSLRSSVSSSSFLISLSGSQQLRKSSLTYTLSICRQSPRLDLFDGTERAFSIIEYLQRWRVDDNVWHGSDFSVFSECEQLAQTAGIELMKPGLTGRQQRQVSQVNADETASDYYKRSMLFPYVDKFSGAAET